ncbi:MAG: energy transducer TonB [Bacteroidales bacterium]|nr:energy transducer TonB [Bacteroidales bacterium]
MSIKVKVMQALTAMLMMTLLILSQMSCKQTGQDACKQQNAETTQLMPTLIDEDGDESDIMEYLGYNLEYPEEAIKAGVNIRATYSFVVEEDGSVSDIQWITTHVEKDGDNPEVIASQKACEKAAYEFIASTSKQWKPAEKDNMPVKAEMSLPIWFKFH